MEGLQTGGLANEIAKVWKGNVSPCKWSIRSLWGPARCASFCNVNRKNTHITDTELVTIIGQNSCNLFNSNLNPGQWGIMNNFHWQLLITFVLRYSMGMERSHSQRVQRPMTQRPTSRRKREVCLLVQFCLNCKICPALAIDIFTPQGHCYLFHAAWAFILGQYCLSSALFYLVVLFPLFPPSGKFCLYLS